MIKAIAIDDEPSPLEVLENYCSQVPYIQLDRTFTRTSKAKEFLRDHPIDLLFLDIEMPQISGIDFYKSLDKEYHVIFSTAHSEYAIEGFNLSAIDYLLKPYDFNRFLQAAEKARDYNTYLYQKPPTEQSHIFIKADYRINKVLLTDICYIQGLSDYLKIYLASGKPLVARMTMRSLAKQLPENFIRVHRSFIVPLNRISSVRNKTIYVPETEIPVGKTYWREFEKTFKG